MRTSTKENGRSKFRVTSEASVALLPTPLMWRCTRVWFCFAFLCGGGKLAWREKEFITDCWLASFQSLSFLLVTAVFLFWFRKFGIYASQPQLPWAQPQTQDQQQAPGLRTTEHTLEESLQATVCCQHCLTCLPLGLRVKQSCKVSGQRQGSRWYSVQMFVAEMNSFTCRPCRVTN